jgi:hypothetical protein
VGSRVAIKLPKRRPDAARWVAFHVDLPHREFAAMLQQRIACALIGTAMGLICALVALLLSDALAPGRVPPMLAFWGAVGAGALLILGLALLDRRGAPPGLRAYERRGHGDSIIGRQPG